MKKVGMAKKLSHVRQFKDTLLKWAKDPGESSVYFFAILCSGNFSR